MYSLIYAIFEDFIHSNFKSSPVLKFVKNILQNDVQAISCKLKKVTCIKKTIYSY